jgi:hypothetical protein
MTFCLTLVLGFALVLPSLAAQNTVHDHGVVHQDISTPVSTFFFSLIWEFFFKTCLKKQ